MTNDTPDDIIYDYYQTAAFPNQAVGRSILGPDSNIKRFTKNDLSDYISKQYNYSNMAVTAAGNIDEDQANQYIAKYFNNLGKAEIEKPEAGKYQGGDFRKEKDLEQINLLFGFEGVPYLHEDYYKCQVLTSILGGGMSSRLFQEVREKRGLAYSVYAFNYAKFDTALFSVYAGTTADKVNELIDVASDQLLSLADKITDIELNRAISQLKAGLLMSQESTNSRSQKLGGDILAYNRIVSHDEIIKKVESFTKKDLVDLAANIISNSNLNFAAIGKTKDIVAYDQIKAKFK